MSGRYDELRAALEAYNEGPDPDRGLQMIHGVVTRIVRDRRRFLRRPDDLEDVCQEVEIAIAIAMTDRRRKVPDILKMTSTIVRRKIIDANGRGKPDDPVVTTVDDVRWSVLERRPDPSDATSDVHVALLLGDLQGLTDRDRVALTALCAGHDTEGVRAALERHTSKPVSTNAAKQALFRARARLKELKEEGMA